MSTTAIEWTDRTVNPGPRGCSKVSPGCAHCYAERVSKRLISMGKYPPEIITAAGHWSGKLVIPPIAEAVAKILAVKSARDRKARVWKRQRVFAWSMTDPLHADVPIAFVAACIAAMASRTHTDWQMLTKRAHRLPELAEAVVRELGAWPANVWIGVTVEDQRRAIERIPFLLQVPARVRFLSVEPMCGPVVIDRSVLEQIQWLICGGESGSGARPAHPQWIRMLRDACAEAGVPFFFKQWGIWMPRVQGVGVFDSTARHRRDRLVSFADGFHHCCKNAAGAGHAPMTRTTKKKAGRLLDGKEHSAFPVVHYRIEPNKWIRSTEQGA